MPVMKFIWIAITWALGLGPLSLLSQGLPLYASRELMQAPAERVRARQG